MADEESSALESTNRSIRCRYCGQRNQVREAENGEARCGRCRLLLSEEPHKKFADLNKDRYIHPADSRALVVHNLSGKPGSFKLDGDSAKAFSAIRLHTVPGATLANGQLTLPAYATVVLQ